MPIYVYKNPLNGEYFEEMRKFDESDSPLVLEDGTVCERVFSPGKTLMLDKNAEVFKRHGDYVKICKPKYVKFNDGHREKYDPTKHC